VETLHTILLGPYKYLLKVAISGLTMPQKQEVLARMSAFNYSGFDGKVLGNTVFHHQSFVGRDYKAFAQMAPFIIASYLSGAHRQVLLALSKVSSMYTCVFPAYIQALLHAHDFFTSLKPRPACIDFICRPRCKGTFSSCNYSCAYLSPSRCFVSPTAFHLVSTMKKTINLYARSFCKW
jgi:hypothetical protein